ncbi:MAG: thioesterase family protein [Bacteroidota bacterium]|nr:thioesterase family protein [Bacteroidota bacterium]
MTQNNIIHKTNIQIRFNDIDILGHVNNSVFQNYFDLARVQYFNDVIKKEINWKTDTLVLAKIEIEYINPVFLEEEICVLTKTSNLGNKSLIMSQEIIAPNTNQIKTKNIATLVAYNYPTDKTIIIPDNWRNDIMKFENINNKYL